jgi:hypothetical protein
LIHQLELKLWLANNKFHHACFISWPSLGGPKIKRLVAKLEQAIEEDAPLYGLPPSAFSDRSIPKGADWESTMSRALCESISMIAVLGPECYNSDWCGREWAGMLRLEESRLGSADRAILPLVFQPLRSDATAGLLQLEILPPPVKHLQCVDLSRIRLRRSNYEESDEFDDIIRNITARIADIALRLADLRASAVDCAGFVLPAESAFAEFKQAVQRYPFLTES